MTYKADFFVFTVLNCLACIAVLVNGLDASGIEFDAVKMPIALMAGNALYGLHSLYWYRKECEENGQ